MTLISACVESNDDGLPERVVVVVVDTLRADRLPFYGAARDQAPFLAELAEDALVYDRALSTSSWTAPATASLFTSLYPFQHGVEVGRNAHGAMHQRAPEVQLNRIPDAAETLPEIMRRAGYRTFGAAANPNITRSEGFGEGFERFECRVDADAAELGAIVEGWADEIRSAERSFVYIHYMDVHSPYELRTPWLRLSPETEAALDELVASDAWESCGGVAGEPPAIRPGKFLTALSEGRLPLSPEQAFEVVTAAYDNQVPYLDEHLRTLFERLEIGPETLVVFTSDHGEELADHGAVGHPFSLYDELLHVPLFIRLPGAEAPRGRVAEPASLLDVLPTLRALVGLPRSATDVGRDLLSEESAERTLLAGRVRQTADGTVEKKAVQRGAHKLIVDVPGGGAELYDLERDARERSDRSALEPERVGELRALLESLEASLPRLERSFHTAVQTDEEREMLEGLGYFGDG